MGQQLVVEMKGVDAAYGNTTILKNVNFLVPRNIVQVIVGPSGSGKTTLIKLMNGLLRTKKGSVTVFGESVRERELRKLRSLIGYIPQNLGLIESRSVRGNVLLGSLYRVGRMESFFTVFPDEELRLADELIDAVGLGEKRACPVRNLSGGEKRRVAIARSLMQKPKILLADEFLSDLDFVKAKEIMALIRNIKNTFGITVIMVEHNIETARKFGDRIAIVQEGQIKENIPAECVTKKMLREYFSSL